jgi:hypothetical protein
VSTARLRTAAGAAVLAGLLVVPAAADARLKRFQTPSKKIACAYETTDRFIRCDALFLNDVGFRLGTKGKARRIRVTDTVADPRAKVLSYGRFADYGPFRCTSRTTGLTCKHRSNGHGFTLSRRRQKVF